MSRRSTRARRSSSRVQELKTEEYDEELKEIFDDDSEDEAIGDDSDEDPDFEYRDEVQADEDDEFVPDDEDEDEEFAEASRKRKREAQAAAMSKRQRTGEWNAYTTGTPIGHGVNPAGAGPNPYLQMIQSKYGFHGGAAAASPAPGQDVQHQQQMMELRQQQLAQQQALAHQQRLRMLQQQQQQHAAALQHWNSRNAQQQAPGQAQPQAQAQPGYAAAAAPAHPAAPAHSAAPAHPAAPTGMASQGGFPLPTPPTTTAAIQNVQSLASAANAASNAASAFLARTPYEQGGAAGAPPSAILPPLSTAVVGNAHAAALHAQQQQGSEDGTVGLPPPPTQQPQEDSSRLQQHLQQAQQQQLAQQQLLAQQQQLARQQQLAQQHQLLQQHAQQQQQLQQQQAQQRAQQEGGQQEKLTMSQEDLQRVRQLLLEYKMAQQNPDENVRKQALHEARLKMRQYPQLVAVLRAAAQKTAAGGSGEGHPEAPGPQLQANRAWQQQMHEQSLRQQYAERARALQVAKAQQLAMNDGEPVNLSIPFNSFNKSASAEDLGDENDDSSETDMEIQKIMKQCEALAKRLAKLAKSQMEDQQLADAKKEIEEEAKKAAGEDVTMEEAQTDGPAVADPEKEASADTTEAAAPSSEEDEKKEDKKEGSDEQKKEGSDEDEKDENGEEKKEGADEADKKKDDDEDLKGPAIIRRQPQSLQLKLTHYQLVGLNWLNLLHSEKLNGVLADEMGLGKTVQTIALFALLKERDNPSHPHLVVCPTTTLSNWVRELEVWCPSLAVMAYYGEMKEREQLRKVIAENHFDVIVTNYSASTGSARDRQFIKGMEFGYLVLDEAQYIKNKDSKRNKVLSKIKSQNRLLLTGTPLQNNLEELWSLLQFTMPDFFKTAYEFDLMSEDEELTKRRINRMKTIIAPFFLRRLKTSPEVSQGIPEKKIVVEECEMTESQQRSYDNYISQSRKLWVKYKDLSEKGDDAPDDALAKAEALATEGGADDAAQEEEEPTADAAPEPPAAAEATADTTAAPEAAAPTAEVTTAETTETAAHEAAAVATAPTANGAPAGAADVDMAEAKETAAAGQEEPEDEDMGADDEEEPVDEAAAAAAAAAEGDVVMDDDAEFVQMPASSQQVNNIFMQLRKVANHPLLARTRFKQAEMEEIIAGFSQTPAYAGLSHAKIQEDLERRSDFEVSNMCSEVPGLEHYRLTQEMIQDNGKCRRLMELLAELKAGGHRVLLFSQMTRVLDILEVLISQWGYQYLRLDGSTPVVVRQGLIDRFTVDENLFLFLLSTGAGGVGINLTAADVVIFYDISFNPQVDRQAQDRVHRVGQKKPVTIYKLVCKNTVDEHMLRMADRKAKLNDDVLEEGTASKEEKKSKVWMLRSLLSEVFEDGKEDTGSRKRRRKGGAKGSPAKRRPARGQQKEKAAAEGKIEEVPAETPTSS
mmetsp:Transcript_10357/g.42117  ORF Transcript_10357/g.42117 Transcript_10357/m.42117 type:complete len:1436 (+) Transcript_10357:99-4406(+)